MEEENPSIWFTEPGRVEIRSIAKPRPGAGEVLIRTQRTLISAGTEITMLHSNAEQNSTWGEFAQFPRQVGYSHAGIVEELGEGVASEWEGRRVASRCRHAAWVTSKASDLRPIPDKVSFEEATFATLAGVVMNGLRRVRLTFGESVAVFGLGVVGQLTTRLATIAGAGPVFAMEKGVLRRSTLPQQPPMHAADEDLDSLRETIYQHTAGKGVDIAVEATGNAALIPEEARMVREQGRLLLLSSPAAPTMFDFHELCNRRSVTIVGAHGFSQPREASLSYPWTSKRHGGLFLEWLADERTSVAELITHHFPFGDARAAYRVLSDDSAEALAVVFDW